MGVVVDAVVHGAVAAMAAVNNNVVIDYNRDALRAGKKSLVA